MTKRGPGALDNAEKFGLAVSQNVLLVTHEKLVRTIRASVITRSRVTAFIIGVFGASVFVMVLNAILAHIFITAPLGTGIWVLAAPLGGLLCMNYLNLPGAFSTRELTILERAGFALEEELASLKRQGDDMRRRGLDQKNIEVSLGHERDKAHAAYRDVVRQVNAQKFLSPADAQAVGLADAQLALGAGKGDPPPEA